MAGERRRKEEGGGKKKLGKANKSAAVFQPA